MFERGEAFLIESRYYKGFWMFNQEDKEYNNCDLSGYAKMEMKKGKFVINVTIFNIKNNLRYKVYLIRSDNEVFKSICIGDLNINKNIGVLEYNIFNVNKFIYEISKYNVLAIVSIIENEQDIKILVPAVAYKDKKVLWREKLKNEIKKLRVANNQYYCPILKKKINFDILKHVRFPNIRSNFNVEIFKKQVDINFKRCDPFLNKRQDYIWWSVPDIRKLYYFLKLFNIDIKNTISMYRNVAILGLYENYVVRKVYIVLGFLIKNNMYKEKFDKIVKVKDSNLGYGLIFLNPYLQEKIN